MSHTDSFGYDNLSDATVYRVCIQDDNNTVEVSCLGMDCLDSTCNGVYDSVDKLPDWIQDRLAVLLLCDIHPTDSVEGELRLKYSGCNRKVNHISRYVLLT